MLTAILRLFQQDALKFTRNLVVNYQ